MVPGRGPRRADHRADASGRDDPDGQRARVASSSVRASSAGAGWAGTAAAGSAGTGGGGLQPARAAVVAQRHRERLRVPDGPSPARMTSATASSCHCRAIGPIAPFAMRSRRNARSVTAAWYRTTACSTARPERCRTAARQPRRPARLESSWISLGAIQPACANPGSCSAITACSRWRCQITIVTIAANSGTMTTR